MNTGYFHAQHYPTANSVDISYRSIPRATVAALYSFALQAQKNRACASGFHKGNAPIEYIEQHFTSILHDHLKELLFNYFVIHYLYEQILERKIPIACDPRLVDIKLDHDDDARFIFELSLFPKLPLQEWRYLPFKEPKRKKYKDLDRQVDTFCKEEKEIIKKRENETIKIGDWVCFELSLVNEHADSFFEQYAIPLWLKIGDENADQILQSVFVDKIVGQTFITENKALQEYLSTQLETTYPCRITILDAVPQEFFDFDLFKKMFRLKTNKEMYKKMIEVFSYRNNISLRRSMAEESLQLLLTKHRFELPHHLTLRQEKSLLDIVQRNPDYHVYRAQKDFKYQIRKLAERQGKEAILLDHIAYNENVAPNRDDVKAYLNLSNRPRMKEFIYFDMPITKVSAREMPLSEHMLKQTCMREKAINHVIYHLTRK